MEGSLAIVERMTGTRAQTCPWWSFSGFPIVADTISVYPFFESGQLAVVLGSDPPAKLLQAIEVYHLALQRSGAFQREEASRNRAATSEHSAAVREMQRSARG